MERGFSVGLLFLVAGMVCGRVESELDREWQLWKTEHGKSYESQREELERHLVWLSNREYINTHNKNADILGFKLSMNQFTDIVSNQNAAVQMSINLQLQEEGEFAEQYLSQTISKPASHPVMNGEFITSLRLSEDNVPQFVDWRQEEIVTPVKHQVARVTTH